MAKKIILHCDCNSFFASVELLSHPELADKPVAVAGSPEDRRGIILAKNEAAKKFKVQTAEPVWQAKQKCPELVLLAPHHKKYCEYSKIINKIYERYTDRVEAFGIDESWLDVTGSYKLFANTPAELADIIRKTVREETGLTISVGVSFNKVFAKLGSDFKKPDATTVIMPEDVERMVYPLGVETLLFVGNTTRQGLYAMGIKTIGDLARADLQTLANRFGKHGVQLSGYANGHEGSPVRLATEKAEVKSIGNSLTFKRDLVNLQDVKTAVTALSESVAYRLRKKMLRCKSVQIVIKSCDFSTITRQKKTEYATDLSTDISRTAMDLILASWNLRTAIRLISVTAQNLTDEDEPQQTSFLEDIKAPNKKREQLERTMDSIRDRYGRSAVFSGSIINDELGLARIDHEDDD